MGLIRFTERPTFRNPWAEFERIRQGLDELSRNYVDKAKPASKANVFPALNIYEETNRIILTAELPGVKAEHLELSIEGETLSLQGHRERRPTNENCSYHRREIEVGNFSRAITLPVKVDVEQVNARLLDGILTITLLKASSESPRQIKVNAA